MRLGQFFSNIGNKVKNFGMRIGSSLMNIAPKALKVGSFITGALSNLPGFIGTAAGYLNKGLSTAKNVINALPASGFKDKLTNLANKAADVADNTLTKVTP